MTQEFHTERAGVKENVNEEDSLWLSGKRAGKPAKATATGASPKHRNAQYAQQEQRSQLF